MNLFELSIKIVWMNLSNHPERIIRISFFCDCDDLDSTEC